MREPPRPISARDKFEEYFVVSSFFPSRAAWNLSSSRAVPEILRRYRRKYQFLTVLLHIKVQNKRIASSLQNPLNEAINLRISTR